MCSRFFYELLSKLFDMVLGSLNLLKGARQVEYTHWLKCREENIFILLWQMWTIWCCFLSLLYWPKLIHSSPERALESSHSPSAQKSTRGLLILIYVLVNCTIILLSLKLLHILCFLHRILDGVGIQTKVGSLALALILGLTVLTAQILVAVTLGLGLLELTLRSVIVVAAIWSTVRLCGQYFVVVRFIFIYLIFVFIDLVQILWNYIFYLKGLVTICAI